MAKVPLKFQQLQLNFSAHIRDPDNAPKPEGIEDRRMGVYRELFFNNVRSFIENSFPVLHTHYSEVQWVKLIRGFFVRHHSQSPWFVDISKEFVEYLQQEYVADKNDPTYLFELAHYEWAEVALMVEQEEIDWPSINKKGDLLTEVIVLSPVAYCLAYEWPVDQISAKYQPTRKPEQPSFIIVYKNSSSQVKSLKVDPVTARIMELLQVNDELTGRQVLTQLAIEMKHPDSEAAIVSGEKILIKLFVEDILLGVKA
ncbi:MAG TPA: DUF2063 domain-containing protein [Thiotrichaceae bacterium]|nr:DUF2063 domain-containing protein [Thiotrichaceae bacterium]